jgi:hypothetical protein
MVAINPQQTNGAVPVFGNFARKSSVHFDDLGNARRLNAGEEFGEGRIEMIFHVRAEIRQARVGIDGYDWAQTIIRRDSAQHYRGFAFEAADFDDGALSRRAGRESTEKASLIFDQEPGHEAGAFPGAFYGLIDVVGQAGHELFLHL